MYRDAAPARGVELSARGRFISSGAAALAIATVWVLVVAAHDAVVLGFSWRNLLLVATVPVALLWGWRVAAMARAPRVFGVQEGIELRDRAGTRLIRFGDAIAMRRWGPHELQVAYLDWWAGAAHHRLFFACAEELPEDALAPSAPLLDQPLALRSTPRPGDPADPHGTRALLLSLLPQFATYLDDADRLPSGGRVLVQSLLVSSALASFNVTSWWSPGVVLLMVWFAYVASVRGDLRRGADPVIEPTDAALVLHRPKHRVIPWSEVTSAVIEGKRVRLSLAGSVFPVFRLLSPRVFEAAVQQRRRDGDAPNVAG